MSIRAQRRTSDARELPAQPSPANAVLVGTATIEHPCDVPVSSGLVKRMVLELQADPGDASIVALVAAELATNILKFGVRGHLEVWCRNGDTVEILAFDEGPGIAHPDACLVDGYSNGARVTPDQRRLGVGLGTVARLMDGVAFPAAIHQARVRTWLRI